MAQPNITLPKARLADVERRVETRFASIARFAQPRHSQQTPKPLREPFTRAAYESLTAPEKLAHLRSRLVSDFMHEAEEAYRREREEARASRDASPPVSNRGATPPPEDDEPAYQVVDPERLGGYFVSCSCECGRWLHTRGPRPVTRWHNASARASRERARNRPATSRPGDLLGG
jgi:hypothetical protein